MKLIGSFCFTANRVEFNRRLSFIMIYRCDPQLFQKYSGYVRGLVSVRRAINIENPIDEVQRMLLGVQQTIRQRTDLEPLAAQPHLAAWPRWSACIAAMHRRK